MRQLFYLFSFIALVSCLNSCSNNEDTWKYGEKQVLANTEWIYIHEMDGSAPGIPFPTETLLFGEQKFTFIFTNWKNDEKSQQIQEVTTTKLGCYEYKHPNLKLSFEDGTEIEAWISTKNEICFYEGEGFFREFTRQ